MDTDVKTSIEALLLELRSWDENEEPPKTVEELAAQFDLDSFVITRIAQAEAIDLRKEPAVDGADPFADTNPIMPKDAVPEIIENDVTPIWDDED